MTTGSCFCGKVGISYSGEPAKKVLCHCLDCRKISGSTHSVNFLVPEADFVVSGNLKSISKTADSGNPITSYFCPDCGSTLYREGPSFAGVKIIKAGVLDGDVLEKGKPEGELFPKHRVPWQPQMEGAAQM